MGKLSMLAAGALTALFMAYESYNAAVANSNKPVDGFTIAVTQTKESELGDPVISIKGEITNETDRERAVPNVRLAARDVQGREIYHWTVAPDQPRLGSHKTCTFSARLASPPSEVADVEVRLAEKGE